MREHSLGISISLLFHIIVVALLLRVPLDQFIKSKSIVLDFTLEKGRTTIGGQEVVQNRGHKTDELKAGKRENDAAVENIQQATKEDLNKQMHAATDYTARREGAVDRTHLRSSRADCITGWKSTAGCNEQCYR